MQHRLGAQAQLQLLGGKLQVAGQDGEVDVLADLRTLHQLKVEVRLSPCGGVPSPALWESRKGAGAASDGAERLAAREGLQEHLALAQGACGGRGGRLRRPGAGAAQGKGEEEEGGSQEGTPPKGQQAD